MTITNFVGFTLLSFVAAICWIFWKIAQDYHHKTRLSKFVALYEKVSRAVSLIDRPSKFLLEKALCIRTTEAAVYIMFYFGPELTNLTTKEEQVKLDYIGAFEALPILLNDLANKVYKTTNVEYYTPIRRGPEYTANIRNIRIERGPDHGF